MIRTKLLIAVTVALTLVYVIGLGQRAVVLLMDPSWFAKTFGALLVLFPTLAVWSIWVEIRFGIRCESLAKILIAEGYPALSIEAKPSGRAEPASAQRALENARVAAKATPNDWRVWFRLSEALDAAGDRKAARQAARTAIRLHPGG